MLYELASYRLQVFGLLMIPPEVHTVQVDVWPPGFNQALFPTEHVPGPSLAAFSGQMEVESLCDGHRTALLTPLLIFRSLDPVGGEGGGCPPTTTPGSWHGSPEEYY